MSIEKIAERLLKKGDITQDDHDVLVKHASFLNIPINMSNVAGLIGAMSLGSLAVGGLNEIIGKAMQRTKMDQTYHEMKEKIPDLKEYPEEDIKDYFSVVKTFSPKAATNPLVAGALVNKMVQFGGVDHKLVMDLANLQGDTKSLQGEMATNLSKDLLKSWIKSQTGIGVGDDK